MEPESIILSKIKPGNEKQIPYDLTYNRNLMNKTQMSKLEPEAWKHGTD